MRRPTKDFDKTIHYYEKRVDTKYFKVPIKLKTDGKKVEFYTPFFKAEEHGGKKIEHFAEIEALYSYIEDNLALLTPINHWERKIYVRVRGSSKGSVEGHDRYDSIGLTESNIEVFSEVIEAGFSADGRRWKRFPDNPKTVKEFTDNIGYGLEDDGWFGKKDKKPFSRSLIDDTPENREMLVTFAVRFDELRDQFFKAFAPEHVQKFLATAAGTMLLTTGGENDNDK